MCPGRVGSGWVGPGPVGLPRPCKVWARVWHSTAQYIAVQCEGPHHKLIPLDFLHPPHPDGQLLLVLQSPRPPDPPPLGLQVGWMSGSVPDTLDSYLNGGGQGVPSADLTYSGCTCNGSWWYGNHKFEVGKPELELAV